VSASSAENRRLTAFVSRPNFRVVSGDRRVTFEARVPFAAASELDRDNVDVAVVVGATRLGIDIDSLDLVSANNPHHDHDTRRRLEQNTALI
jgi:hypothetical protein